MSFDVLDARCSVRVIRRGSARHRVCKDVGLQVCEAHAKRQTRSAGRSKARARMREERARVPRDLNRAHHGPWCLMGQLAYVGLELDGRRPRDPDDAPMRDPLTAVSTSTSMARVKINPLSQISSVRDRSTKPLSENKDKEIRCPHSTMKNPLSAPTGKEILCQSTQQ